MRKLSLTALAAVAMILTGCGQNVEQLKAEHIKKQGVTAEASDVEFTGYAFIVREDKQKEADAFSRENRLPAHLSLKNSMTDDGELAELPSVNFKNDTFKNITDLRSTYTSRVKTLRKQASVDFERDMTAAQQKIAAFEQQIAEINTQREAYTILFADERAAYDTAFQAGVALDEKMKALESQFQTDMKKAIIDNGLSIDVSKTIHPGHYYRHEGVKKCGQLNQSEIRYLDDKSIGCIQATLKPENLVLTSLVHQYGVDKINLILAIRSASAEQTEKYDIMSKAEIVARNKTSFNKTQADRKTMDLERQITNAQKTMQNDIKEMNIFYSLRNRDEELKSLEQRYSTLAKQYNKEVRIAALRKASPDVYEITDETDSVPVKKGDFGVLLYAFTHNGNVQHVYVAPVENQSGKNDYLYFLTYSSKPQKFDFTIDNKASATRAIEQLL